MEYFIKSWKRGDCNMDFYGKLRLDQTPIISAHIMSGYGLRKGHNIVIPEENIVVETRNCHALQRGLNQISFRLSGLNKDQKMKIMETLGDRSISFGEGGSFGNELFIFIHALP